MPGEPDIGKDQPENVATLRWRRTLVDAELVASVSWLIRLRWIAGAGVILTTWIVAAFFGLKTAQAPLFLVGAAILLYNLAFFLIERKLKRVSAKANSYLTLAMWQVGMDWLAMTLLIHFSGGIESPAIFFFVFHIIIASIFFTPRVAFGFTALAILLLSGTATLEYFVILPHNPVQGLLDAALYRNGLYVTAILFFFGCTALISAYLVTSIQQRLRTREEEVIRLSESLQRASQRLQTLNDGARTVGSTLELHQVLDRLVESTAKALQVRACSIFLLDQAGKRLEIAAAYGLSQAYVDKGPLELESNPLATKALQGSIVNLHDISQDPKLLQYPEFAMHEGIRAMLTAPLTGKEKPLGMLRAYSEAPDHFNADDESFLAAIAAQGSIAIENALAYQAIAQLDATKSQFVRMVTHELRSPVGVARSLLRNITAGYVGQVSPAQQDILERASRRLEYLQKLIDDLLDLATGKTVVTAVDHYEKVPLEEVLQKVVARYKLPAQEKGLELEWHIDAGEKPNVVLATYDGLDRVFNNLISNAVKYTTHGMVRVTLTILESEAQVLIEDTGIGIPDEAVAHLFEEFYRAPNAREMVSEGTGLGLTIVKDTLARFGGRVSVHSQQDVGTRFSVTLPLVEQKEVTM